MSRPSLVVDQRDAQTPWAFCGRVMAALDAGHRVQLRPGPAWGFVITKNGPSILATDFDEMPIGTFPKLVDAFVAWERTRAG